MSIHSLSGLAAGATYDLSRVKLAGAKPVAKEGITPSGNTEVNTSALRSAVHQLHEIASILNGENKAETNPRQAFMAFTKALQAFKQSLQNNPEAAKQYAGLSDRLMRAARGFIQDWREANAANNQPPPTITTNAANSQETSPSGTTQVSGHTRAKVVDLLT